MRERGNEKHNNWLLSFKIGNKQFRGKGEVQAYCSDGDRSLKIKEWVQIPEANIVLVIISYTGILPFELCYEREDVVILHKIH